MWKSIISIFYREFIENLENNTISIKQAKEIFTKVLYEKKEPNNYISKDNAQISDKDALVEIIDTILENNPKQIEDYKNGRTNLFDYFVGQVMKETRGKANPVIEPVLPNASTKIKRMLNLNPYKWEEEMISGDYKLTDVEILYNRLEEKKLK